MTDVHDLDGMEALRRSLRLDPHRLKRMWVSFYKNHGGAEAALEELPAEVRDSARSEIRFHTLSLHARSDSSIDGASKLVFKTEDGHRIETVILRIKSKRTALCVSSQIGCAAGCRFCATGQAGIARNLCTAEILDQVVQANAILREENRQVRNIVFMGMGEPMHNESAVGEALEALCHPALFHHSPRKISVSTVGIPEAMRRFVERFPKVRLALSLHSARAEVRESIIPLTSRHGLAELREAIEHVTDRSSQEVMLEYLMLEDRSDRPEDLEALVRFARGLAVHINLIPYNPIAAAPELRGTSRANREAFGAELRTRGFPVTLRYSLGADVTAACGQLLDDSSGI